MNNLNTLLAIAGVTVTLLVVVAMVLLTPSGAVPARRGASDPSASSPPLVPVVGED